MSAARFFALRFTEDENLRDRVYWYLGGEHADYRENERVFAPVGPHDRLQCARVERSLLCEEREAPYDPPLCKRVVCRLGERKLSLCGMPCFETGGVRYDDRHYTQFRRILVCETLPAAETGLSLVEAGEGDISRIIEERGCVLLYGEGAAKTAARLLAIVKGEEEAPSALKEALLEKMTLGRNS